MSGKEKVLIKRFKPGKMSPGFLLWEVGNLWQRIITNELSKIELTPVQFYLLSGLKKLCIGDECAVKQIDLARFTQMNAMMTSNVLRTLEKKMLIKRVAHPNDSRAIILELTKAGSEVWCKGIDIMKTCNNQFFDLDINKNKAFMDYMMVLRDKHK